jgi:hypothetical protein
MIGLLRNLQSRERRALGALAGAGGLFLMAQFVAFPWMEATEKLRASLPLKEKTLHKYQNLAALIGPRETDWRNIQERLAEAERGLLDSKAAALASAELQQRLQELAEQHGIELRSTDFPPVRPLKPADTGYASVPIGLSLECTLDQLVDFLAAAAAGPKTLSIEQLSMIASPPRPDRQRKMVMVRMVVRGLMAQEAPAPPKS